MSNQMSKAERWQSNMSLTFLTYLLISHPQLISLTPPPPPTHSSITKQL